MGCNEPKHYGESEGEGLSGLQALLWLTLEQ